MKMPPILPSESERVAILKRCALLDTPPDPIFDNITQAAAKLCETPMALITLVDTDRQWFKSSIGFTERETPRDIALCAHTIATPTKLMEIEDTLLDKRFHDNPLITGEPKIRFYAGKPLVTTEGYALGTLAVIDREPRILTTSQREGLNHLADTISALIEKRRQSPAKTIVRAVENTLRNGLIVTDANQPDNPIIYCNQGFEAISGYKKEEILGRNCRFLQGKDTSSTAIRQIRDAIAEARECTVTLKNFRRDGTAFWNELTVSPIRSSSGDITHFLGIQTDVSEQRRAEDALRKSEFELKQAHRLAKIGFWEWDIDTRRIVHCSDSLPQLLGITPEALLGDPESFFALLDERDRQQVADIESKLARCIPGYEENFRLVRPGGETRYFREVGEPVVLDDGEGLHFRATLQDVTDQKLAAEQLNESRRRLTTLINNLPGMAYRCRNDSSYTMEFVSDGCFQLTGYQAVDLIENRTVSFMDLIDQETRLEDRAKVLAALERKSPFTLEYRLTTSTGEQKWVWEQGFGIYSDDDEVHFIEGYIVDITDRKKAELARRSSDARFRGFSRIAADWFWEMGADLRFTYASGRFEEVMGITAEDVIGRSRRELHSGPTYYPNQWEKHLKTLERHESFQDFELIWTRPDGAKRNIAISGEPLFNDDGNFTGYRGVGRDITAQKRTESQLQAFFDLSPDAIVIIDAKSTILFANAMASTLFGYTHEELVGRSIDDLVPEGVRQHHASHRQSYFSAPNTRVMGLGMDLSARRGDGSEFPVEIGLSPIEDAGQTLVLATVRDISERKQYEAQARQLLLDHAHDARLSTAGELASGLAHELNQPLTAISSNCDTGLSIASKSPGIDPELVDILEENYEYAHRAGQIIHSLRKLVQKGQHDRIPTDVNSLIEGTVKLIGPEARAAQVRVQLELGNELPLIALDAVQIQQVLVNLERNAIEALHCTDSAHRILTISSSLEAQHTVKVTVQDNGRGISTDIANEIFKPHVTFRKDGMGLGLSISRSMIEAHSGQIWFDREVESGAVFHFTLPVNQEIER